MVRFEAGHRAEQLPLIARGANHHRDAVRCPVLHGLDAYTAIPEWGGRKLRITLEDDAVVTERGVEWLYPVNQKVLLIR